MSSRVKILFEVIGPALGENDIESLWALPVKSGFRIDNIPFYAKSIALEDIVTANADSGGALWFCELAKASGHSTLRILFKDESAVQGTRDALRSLGCASELSELPTLIAVDVPPTVRYSVVREFLDERERLKLLEYEEACLAHDADP